MPIPRITIFSKFGKFFGNFTQDFRDQDREPKHHRRQKPKQNDEIKMKIITKVICLAFAGPVVATSGLTANGALKRLVRLHQWLAHPYSSCSNAAAT
jgi:hypothetical protein